jgi:hypothetical protein
MALTPKKFSALTASTEFPQANTIFPAVHDSANAKMSASQLAGGYKGVASDADFALAIGTDAQNVRHTGTLTANRAVTLTADANCYAGAKWKITRTGAGAFNLNVGTGPLKALATNTWAEFTYDGAAWYLSAYGAL